MFKVEQPKSVKWPVTVNIPQDGGHTRKNIFNAQFELLAQDDFAAIYREEGGNDEDLLRRVLIGWSEVGDPDGNPIEFDKDARELLIRIPYVRTALVAAYIECSSGKAASRKN